MNKPFVLITLDPIRLSNGFEIFSKDTPAHVIVKTIEELIFIATKIESLEFGLKFRPGNFEPDFYNGIAERLGGLPDNFKFITKGSTPELLKKSKLLLTMNSSSIFEAFILCVPVIRLEFPGVPDAYGFSEFGISVKTTKELEERLIELLEDKLMRQNFIAGGKIDKGDHCTFGSDGKLYSTFIIEKDK